MDLDIGTWTLKGLSYTEIQGAKCLKSKLKIAINQKAFITFFFKFDDRYLGMIFKQFIFSGNFSSIFLATGINIF